MATNTITLITFFNQIRISAYNEKPDWLNQNFIYWVIEKKMRDCNIKSGAVTINGCFFLRCVVFNKSVGIGFFTNCYCT